MFPETSQRTFEQHEVTNRVLEVCSDRGLIAANGWLDKIQQMFDVQVCLGV
jgi:hypothetical protein